MANGNDKVNISAPTNALDEFAGITGLFPLTPQQAPPNIDPTTAPPPGTVFPDQPTPTRAAATSGAMPTPALLPITSSQMANQAQSAGTGASGLGAIPPMPGGLPPFVPIATKGPGTPPGELPPQAAAAPMEALPLGAAQPSAAQAAAGARAIPSAVGPGMPTPPPIPRQTTGQKILGALGKIGGIGLGAVAPGVAAMIPGTPLGQIVAQQRQLRTEALRAQQEEAMARVQTAQTEAQTAQTQAQTAQMEARLKMQAAPYQIQSLQADAQQKMAEANLEADPAKRLQMQADAQKSLAEARKAQVEADKDFAIYRMMQNPQDISGTVAATIPPGPNYADIRTATEGAMRSAMQMGDFKGAQEALEKGVGDAATRGTEMNAGVLDARAAAAAMTQKLERAGTETANVPPGNITALNASMNKYTQDYAKTMSGLENLQAELASAKDGNEVANAFAPIAFVLGQNDFMQTHRFNVAESTTIDNVGSIGRRLNALLDKTTTGKIPEATRKEFQSLGQELIKGANNRLTANINMTNAQYHSTYDPQTFISAFPTAATTPETAGATTSAAAGAPQRPEGVPANAVFDPQTRQWRIPISK